MIVQAIDSVLAQTLPASEIIVVDDGSEYPVDKAALEARDPRIRVLLLPENVGGSGARNAGIDAATGDWVAFLDSDDRWLPERLERQFSKELLEAADPVVAAANVLVVDEVAPDRPVNPAPQPAGIPMCEWFLEHRGTYQTSTLLLKRSLASEVRFDPRLRRHQDWDFLLRLERHGARIQYTHECLAVYNNTAADSARISMTRSFAPTQEWFGHAGRLLTPRSKYKYYMRYWYTKRGMHRTVYGNYFLARLMIAWPPSVVPFLQEAFQFCKALPRRTARRLIRTISG
jgi:glycosyltransferase involved in cell wall biosynthesis